MPTADQIVHLHARGSRAARRVRDVLGRARLRPVALSPSAVLAVRRLDDPLPGGLGSGRRVPPRWERAARDALAGLHRRAARPRGGRVPEAAEAVLFADEAEWRACAARAFAHGARPWWTDTLPRQTVAAVLTEAPRLTPAIVDLLVGWGEAVPALAVLSSSEADALTAMVCEAAAVADLSTGSLTPPPGTPRLGADLPWTSSESLARAVAEADRRVGRAQAVLLGVAGTLARAPHRLRCPDAVAAVGRWRATATAPSRTSWGDEISPQAEAEPGGRGADPTHGLGVSEVHTPIPEPLAPRPPPSPPAQEDSPSIVPSGTTPSAEATTVGRADLEAGPAPPATATEPAPPEAEPRTDGTATDLGGAFFLLPVMRAFGWPEAAEDAWRLASTTGAWGALEALARGLLAGAHPDDPLWRLLARLDGREPGTPPRDAVAGVTDRPASGPGLSPALTAWTRAVLPEVEARLVDALGLAGPADIPEAVLIREATVYATRSHVDVVFPLAAASLAVRRAGLDADPGWVPSAGRVVLFHYR